MGFLENITSECTNCPRYVTKTERKGNIASKRIWSIANLHASRFDWFGRLLRPPSSQNCLSIHILFGIYSLAFGKKVFFIQLLFNYILNDCHLLRVSCYGLTLMLKLIGVSSSLFIELNHLHLISFSNWDLVCFFTALQTSIEYEVYTKLLNVS